MSESSSDAQDDDFETEAQDISIQNDSLVTRMAGPSSGKAGLENIDKDLINKKIYELSKGSKFFENEKLRDAKLSSKIDSLLEKHKKVSLKNLCHTLPVLAELERKLEEERDLTQTIVHVDMDAFYAAVEILDNPELKGKPIGVGGMSMLCTASYEARKFGVRSAMPGFIGKELCPELIIVPCHFKRYQEMSGKIQEVFALYDPNYRQVSLDEAYLNITDFCQRNSQDPQEAVCQLRKEIFEKTKLTASAGIAANKLIAKICSDFNKPNGQTFVPSTKEDILKFMSPLSVRKISGIGRVTERVLNNIGVKSCQDLYEQQSVIFSLFSEKTFNFLFASCLGIGSTTLLSYHTRKSISTERTFRILSTWEDLTAKLAELADSLASDVDRRNLEGKTITLKIKTPDFQVRIKSKTLPKAIYTKEELYLNGEKLLKQEFPVSMRLMGLRLSNLSTRDKPSSQPMITKFWDRHSKSENIDEDIEEDQNSSDIEIIEANPSILPDSKTEKNDKEQHKQFPDKELNTIDKSSTSRTTTVTEHVPEVFKCPACSQIFVDIFTTLDQINTHLDGCLKPHQKLAIKSSGKRSKKPSGSESESRPSTTILSFFQKHQSSKKAKR